MLTNEKAPTCWRRVGAQKQESLGKHPVPIVTHPAYRGKHVRRRRRYKLIWTPINSALLILVLAVLIYILVRGLTVSPLEQHDLITMANSVFRV